MSNLENPLPNCPSSPNCKRVSFVLESDSSSVFQSFEEVLDKMNTESISSHKEKKRIDAVFKIPVFGFKDDVSVAMKADGNSTNVFIRSASREGYWDIWVNGIRVRRIIKLVKKNLST
tara:strand:- start:7484 stop:7837 length:354 start_codon:yes stop_codon:yes gene_type:complete